MSSNENHAMGVWFIFLADRLLIKSDHTLPTHIDIKANHIAFIRQHMIGQFNANHCYAAEIASDAIPDDMHLISLRQAFEIIGIEWYPACVKSYAVINWDKNHQFCGQCGNITNHQTTIYERVCSACGLVFYPRISPSVIVLIQRDDYLLMARSPHFRPGIYGLIAGFVEVGESIEEAVHREVHEEVGLKINNLQYFGSQSWPFPDSLMIGFTADYLDGELLIDTTEIEEADWYRYDKLPGIPGSNISIASKLIKHFVEKKSHLTLDDHP